MAKGRARYMSVSGKKPVRVRKSWKSSSIPGSRNRSREREFCWKEVVEESIQWAETGENSGTTELIFIGKSLREWKVEGSVHNRVSVD